MFCTSHWHLRLAVNGSKKSVQNKSVAYQAQDTFRGVSCRGTGQNGWISKLSVNVSDTKQQLWNLQSVNPEVI